MVFTKLGISRPLFQINFYVLIDAHLCTCSILLPRTYFILDLTPMAFPGNLVICGDQFKLFDVLQMVLVAFCRRTSISLRIYATLSVYMAIRGK
jgi:hypothetical protein